MTRLVKMMVLGCLAIVLLFGVTAAGTLESTLGVTTAPQAVAFVSPSAVAPVPAPDALPDAVVTNPDIVTQYGPVGGLLTVGITGFLMVMRSINEGKKINVQAYKDRASEAESQAKEDIGKIHQKLIDMETKLDDVIKDRDEYRDTLEERKAHFTQQFIELENRHRRELEEMHAVLVIEIHTRHNLERIMAEKGIKVPDSPPPYTRAMKESVTAEDHREADRGTNTGPQEIIRPFAE